MTATHHSSCVDHDLHELHPVSSRDVWRKAGGQALAVVGDSLEKWDRIVGEMESECSIYTMNLSFYLLLTPFTTQSILLCKINNKSSWLPTRTRRITPSTHMVTATPPFNSWTVVSQLMRQYEPDFQSEESHLVRVFNFNSCLHIAGRKMLHFFTFNTFYHKTPTWVVNLINRKDLFLLSSVIREDLWREKSGSAYDQEG